MIERFIPKATLLRHPTRDVVLAELPSSQAVHFACHGYADGGDPAASQLILYDHQTHPLSVAALAPCAWPAASPTCRPVTQR